jgi:hypothetical protein
MDSHILLMGLGRRKPEAGADDDIGEPEPSPSEEALDEFMREFKAGNHSGAKEALRSAIRICSMERSSEAEEDAGD